MARGPGYPFVNLEEAVELSRKMYSYTRRSAADANAVIQEAWNYSPASSSGKKILAALGYFGLLESESESGEGRKVRLSDRAYRILIDDPGSTERKQALRDAVLSPKAYLLCWKRWGREMPPSMRSNLIFSEGFIESTVDGFLADYRKSVEYAGLLENPSDSELPSDEPDATSSQFAVEATSVLGAGRSPSPIALEHQNQHYEHSGDERSDVFSLNEGTVRLSWPKALSEESFQDFSDWLDLMKRKIQRTVSRES